MKTLQKEITLNQDYKTRDAIIAEFPRFNKLDWINEQSIYHFEIPLGTLDRLLDLKFADPQERQNEAPPIRSFQRLAHHLMKNHQDNIKWITFGGYAISPEREDYRISIDTITIEGYFDEYLLLTLIKFGLKADELRLTKDDFRAWWD